MNNPITDDQQLMGRVSRIDAIQQQSMANASRANQEYYYERWASL